MIEIIINAIRQALISAGFTVLTVGSQPRSNSLKSRYIAFITLDDISCRQTGYDFDTGARKRDYYFSVKCRLLGKEGDCSDRQTLLDKAYSAQLALIGAGYDAQLTHDMKIDGVLSRAECVIRTGKTFTHTPAGGS